MNIRKINRKWFLIPFYMVVLAASCLFLYSYTHTDAQEVYLTPTIHDQNGWEIYTLDAGKKTKIAASELNQLNGKTAYMSRRLDASYEDEGYTTLRLPASGFLFSVFLEGKLIYTADPSAGHQMDRIVFSQDDQGSNQMAADISVTLPGDYSKKTLTIALTSFPEGQEYPSPFMVVLTGNAIQSQLSVSDANRISIPAAALMVIALLLLGLYFYSWYHENSGHSLLLLALAALAASLNTFLAFENTFSSHFTLNIPFSDALIPLAFCLPVIYLLLQMKRWRKWGTLFIVLPMFLYLGFYITAHFKEGISYHEEFLYVSFLAAMIFGILEWKGRRPFFKLFAPTCVVIFILLFALSALFELNGIQDVPPVMTVFHVLSLPVPATVLYYLGMILLLLSGAVSFLQVVSKISSDRTQLAVMKVKNEMLSETISSIETNSEKLAEIRHNFLHHIKVLSDLNERGEQSRLKTYLAELSGTAEEILPLRVCANPIVNAIVSRALNNADKNQIDLRLQIDLPQDIAIPDEDLCDFLSNLLDNALAGVLALTQEKRWIEFTIHIRGRYLFIETINPVKDRLLIDNETGVCQSTKGSGHGYGMKTMAAIAARYSSKLQVEQKDGTLLARTALLIP